MEENKNEKIANNTEIPLSEAPPIGGITSSPKKFDISKLPLKTVAIFGFVLIVIVGLAFFLMSGNKNREVASDYQNIYNQADEAYRNGDLDGAEKIVDQALGEYQDDTGFLAHKINIISQKGNLGGLESEAFEKAKPFIDKIAGKDELDAQIAVGYAYETAGDYQKAYDHFNKATAIDPNSSDAWFHKAHSLEFLNRQEEANTAYEKSLELDSSNSLALLRRGNLNSANGNFDAAIKDLEAIADIANASSNTKAKALGSLANIKRAQLDIPGALQLSTQAVELDPNDSFTLGSHGYNQALNGNPDEGIETLKKAISLNPRISWNYNLLGEVYRAKKMYNEALTYHRDMLIKLENDNTILGDTAKQQIKGRYTYNLAKTYAMSGLQTDVVRMLQEAVELNPQMEAFIRTDSQKTTIFNAYSANPEFIALIQ